MKSKINFKTRLASGILLTLLPLMIFESISMAGFADLNTSQIRDDIVLAGALGDADSIGQTFTAQKAYLSSIKILLDSHPDGQTVEGAHPLFFHLQDGEHTEIASGTYSIPSTAKKLEVEFSFPPQPDSLNKSYQLLIETDAPAGQFSIWSSFFDSYPGGDILLNGQPFEFDMTFQAYYRPPVSVWVGDVLHNAGAGFLQLFSITIVFCLVGFLICFLLGYLPQDLVETVVYAVAAGIAAPPLLFLLFGLLGIRINQVNILIVLGLLLASSGFKYLISFRTGKNTRRVQKFNRTEVTLLGLMFVLAAFTRASQAQDLIMPNWVDGIVHQEFLTRIIDRQYMSFDAIYPKGFHANVAFEHLLFGGPLPESILMMGQWLSLISGLTFYLLARRFLRPTAALFALGLYWFWAAFPAYLINWGRYPYLQGLVLLPAAVTIYRENFPGTFARSALLTLLSIALGLTYYGSFMILAVFVIADLTGVVSKDGYVKVIQRSRGILLSMLPVILVMLVRLNRALENRVYGQDSTFTWLEDGMHTLGLSLSHGGVMIWGLGVLGLLLTLVIKNHKLLSLAAWIFILLLINLSQSVLDVTISSFSNTIIFLSIPLALLSGYVLRLFLAGLEQRHMPVIHAGILLMALGGAYAISGIVAPSTVLYLPADQRAMEWVARNTPADSVFMINSFQWGNDRAPSDGGAWMTAVTGRETVLFDAASLEDLIEDEQVDYVYTGRGYGDIHADALLNDPRFSLMYDREGVRIFRLDAAGLPK